MLLTVPTLLTFKAYTHNNVLEHLSSSSLKAHNLVLFSPAGNSFGVESKEENAPTPQSTEEESMETSDDVLRLNDIPESCQKGWWRVTSQATIRQILLNLNSRGIRERNLQKQFHKNLNDSKELLKTMPNDQGKLKHGICRFKWK